MLGLAAVPSIIMFFGCLVLPESPRWLVSRGLSQQAKKVLVKLRGTDNVEDELLAMQTVCEEDSLRETKSFSFTQSITFQMATTKCTRRALLVGCMLQAIQQLSGINTVMYYSATIVQMSGIQGDQLAIWLAAVVAFGNFAFTIVGVFLVERLGRRKLLLGSLAGVTISLFLLGGAFYMATQHDAAITFHEKTSLDINSNKCPATGYCLDCLKEKCGFCSAKDPANNLINGSCVPINVSSSDNMAAFGRCSRKDHSVTWSYQACPYRYAWLAIVFLVLYIAAFAPGMGPMPWTINSEIYPLWARSTGNAFATATNWTCNLVISMTFLSLTEWITHYGAFWLYGGISFFGWLFFFVYLPETKKKSLEELQHLFS